MGIEPGLTATAKNTVRDAHCTRRGDYRILSTPNLIQFIEDTAAEALAGYLGDRQASVGTRVAVAHEASTLLGQEVTCTATVTAVDRRRVTFRVEAFDPVERIASGEHDRFVVDLDVLESRLSNKADAAARL